MSAVSRCPGHLERLVIGIALGHHLLHVLFHRLDEVLALDAEVQGDGCGHEHRRVDAEQNADRERKRKVVQRRTAEEDIVSVIASVDECVITVLEIVAVMAELTTSSDGGAAHLSEVLAHAVENNHRLR